MIALYGHRFAAFAWKPLIAAYARGIAFEFREVSPEYPEHMAQIAELSPTGQFPALVDGDAAVTGSNAVIAWLDRYGDAPPLVPPGDAGIRARELAETFDAYVAVPMQRIVSEAFRGDGEKDPKGVADARATLERSYAWFARRIRDGWATGDAFTIADCAAAPALFYADWVQPIPVGALADYRARLLAHPAVARVVDEARPYRPFFPLGAPDRD